MDLSRRQMLGGAVGAIGAELADDELVLGVSVQDEARAYPLNMMYAAPHTKVLNDVLGESS